MWNSGNFNKVCWIFMQGTSTADSAAAHLRLQVGEGVVGGAHHGAAKALQGLQGGNSRLGWQAQPTRHRGDDRSRAMLTRIMQCQHLVH